MARRRRIVFTKRLQLNGLLSVPSGMPLGWVFSTFQIFLVNLGVSRGEIGLLSGVSLPWTLKFLWAPLVDRFAFRWPGRRRSWIIVTQGALAATFGALAAYAAKLLAARAGGAPLPPGAPLVLGGLALLVAFLSATQDIAYDAYTVEFLRPEEHGAAPGVRAIYYRVGMLLAGALAIGVSDALGWPLVFAILGVVFAAFTLVVLAVPEPERPPAQRSLRQAVVEPIASFFRRTDAVPLALFLVLYKFGDNMAGTMVNPFLKDLCFSNAEIGAAVKTGGLLAAMIGSAVAAGVTLRIGVARSLWVFGVVQALANLLYAGAAMSRHAPMDAHLCASLPSIDLATRAWAYAGIAGEQCAQSMASVAQGALLLRVTDRENSVTQFALLSSLFAVGRWTAGLPSGFLVDALGYPTFFAASATVMALPGFWFLNRIAPFGRREMGASPAPPPAT